MLLRDNVSTTVLLQAKAISHSFSLSEGKTIDILRHINLEVYENEILFLLGPSGCGKSTLLRILTGLLQPASGSLLYRGQPLNGPKEHPSLGWSGILFA